jgi:hypothetical protein
MKEIAFEEKNYPIRQLEVKVDGETEHWTIGCYSLRDDVEPSLSLQKLIIDEEVIFYVDDDDIYKENLHEILKRDMDVGFEFVRYIEE